MRAQARSKTHSACARHPRILLRYLAGHFAVLVVTRPYPDDVSADAPTGEEKVAQYVEHLVVAELVRESQRLTYAVPADDDDLAAVGIPHRARGQQIVRLLGLDERPCGADPAPERLGRHLYLGQAFPDDVGGMIEVVGQSESVARKGKQKAVIVDEERALDDDLPARRVLLHNSDLLDSLDERRGAAVDKRNLPRVDPDDGVVDAHAVESAEDVLDDVHLAVGILEIGKGGAVFGLENVLDRDGDRKNPALADKLEGRTVVGRGGMDFNCDVAAGEDPDAFYDGYIAKCPLGVGHLPGPVPFSGSGLGDVGWR